jgi:DNA-binding NarL/FixJ family response regulator
MKRSTVALTKEERSILILGAPHPSGKRLSNAEIGQRLGVPVSRVKAIMHEACVKLEAHNRIEAMLFAVGRGEMNIKEFYSLDELAKIYSTLGPDGLKKIAYLLRQELKDGLLPGKHEQVLATHRRQDGKLTNREQDVLVLVIRGLTNKEIADTLCMSASAVRKFLNQACTKLGASKRADAAVLALEQGEISIGAMSSLDEVLQSLAPVGAESLEKIAEMLEQKCRKESVSTGS